MLHFAYPWLFLLLLPLPWLVRRFLPPRLQTVLAVHVPFVDRILKAGGSHSITREAVQTMGRLLVPTMIWLLVVIALARPQWLEAPISRDQPTRDLLLLVDLSGSMHQEDFTNMKGNKVDRLQAVKEVLGEFLLRRQGDRVGLVVFGSAPFLQAPFSTDLNLVKQLLEETAVAMAGPRTAFGDAMGLGVTLFAQSDAPAKTIIALTDGNDTESQVPPVEAARVAHERGIRIYTVAIGDPTTVGEEKLDQTTLRSVAEATGGSFFFAGNRQNLETIYQQLDALETRQVKVVSYRPRRDLFYWPILLALLLSLGEQAIKLLRWHPTRAGRRPTNVAVWVDPISGRLEVRK